MKRPLKTVPSFVVAFLFGRRGTAGARPARERFKAKALALLFSSCLLGPAAHAQEAAGDKPSQASPAASGGSVERRPGEGEADKGVTKAKPVSEKIESLRLGWAGRLARGFQYQYQLNEQTGSVLIGSPAEIVENPEDYLQQHTFTFKFGELFPDRLALFKRGSDYLKKFPPDPKAKLPADILCGDKPLITCLTKGGRWWQRALMGTSFNVTLSERAAVQQGFIVSDPMFGHDYQTNVGFTFDPAKLFPTATGWKAAFDEVQKVDKALAYAGASDAHDGGRPWRKDLWAAYIIPKVEFKVLSQFDFVKYNGTLVEAPFRERALNTLTFTWDLTRAIPDTKSRTDADAVAESLSDLKKGLGVEEPTVEPTWQKRCVIHLSREDRMVDVHPGFPATSCRRLAAGLGAKAYRLSCIFRKGASGKPEQQVDGPEIFHPQPPDARPDNKCGWPVK